MKKTVKIIAPLLFLCVLLAACGVNRIILMPFEADIEKHMEALIDKSIPADDFFDTRSSCVLLENEHLSVSLSNENAIVFYQKSTDTYYDTFGNALESPENAELNLLFKSESGNDIFHTKSEYFNARSGEYIPTCTAFLIAENTVRLIYISGADEFYYFASSPILLSEETYNATPELQPYYEKASADNQTPDAAFVAMHCTAKTYYIRNGNELPEEISEKYALDSNAARKEILALGYLSDTSRIAFTVVDITLDSDRIVFDVSKNRQYKTEAMRTSEYTEHIFEFELPFVEITHSESDVITFAGSKY